MEIVDLPIRGFKVNNFLIIYQNLLNRHPPACDTQDRSGLSALLGRDVKRCLGFFGNAFLLMDFI